MLNCFKFSGSTPYPHFIHPITGQKLPNEEYLVRTVLMSNMTIITNGIENFKQEMENKLTEAYRHAYVVNRYRRDVSDFYRRYARSAQADEDQPVDDVTGREKLPMVKIHNIRSSLPEPEIEMIYTVSKGEQ